MRNRYRFVPIVLVLLPLLLGADRGCVLSPPPDSIVVQNRAAVIGAVGDGSGNFVDAEVDLTVNGRSQGRVNTQNGFFSYANVALSPGKNFFAGTTRRVVNGQAVNGPIDRSQVHLRSDLVARGRQDVVFSFTSASSTRLREIAIGSLQGPLSPAQLDQFVAGVQAKTGELFDDIYEPYNVVRVAQPTPDGGGAVTVTFEDEDPGVPNSFGTTIPAPADNLFNLMQAIPDFNNQRKTQVARVFVGAFKRAMIDQGQLLNDTGASLTDSLEDRIRDLGMALSRTAAHEVAHTLGLVSQPDLVREIAINRGIDPHLAAGIAALLGIPNPLPDLGGCREAHNCPDVDLNDPLADRFGEGFFIMDPGELAPLFARLGFADATSRTERLPRFNNFNDSYLRIVHPKP